VTTEAPILTGPATLEPATLDRAWDLAPQVSVRPEAFGALLYHFGTRRLSFLKDRRLLQVVQHLADAPTARAACLDAGVTDAELPAFATAIDRLAATDMLRERTAQP
jgi:putative mycofactocin binding protein MftB